MQRPGFGMHSIGIVVFDVKSEEVNNIASQLV